MASGVDNDFELFYEACVHMPFDAFAMYRPTSSATCALGWQLASLSLLNV